MSAFRSCVLACLMLAVQGVAGDQSRYFEAGKAFGQARKDGVAQGIGTGQAQAKVPGYNTAPPETAHYGLTDLVAPRQAKISGCASARLDPKSRADQECIAVNLIQSSPAQRPQFNLNPQTDPTLTRSAAVVADPTRYAGQLDGTFSECQTTTTTTAAIYETAVCNRYASVDEYTCHKKLNVSVTQPQPIPAIANYSCPAGQTLAGGSCVAPALAASVNYACLPGSTLDGAQCQPAPSTASVNYSCGAGQTLSGTSCSTPAVSATQTYSCPQGGTLSGAQCTPSPTAASVSYACPAGSTLNGTSCQAPAYQPPAQNAHPAWRQGPIVGAPVGQGSDYQSWVNTTCGGSGRVIEYFEWQGILYWQCNILYYTCPSGYTLSGSLCYPPLVTPPPTAATPVYSCPSGSALNGTSCQASSYNASVSNSCPAGTTLSGTTCLYPTAAATASYSCPVGNALSGTQCYPPPTGATISYTCPAGATLTGSNCQPPATAAAVTYTCGPGATLSGDTCITTPVITRTWSDECADYEARLR